MKKKNEHTIERQEIILNLKGSIVEKDLKSIQEAVAKLYKNAIGEKMDQIFSSLVPEDVDIRIDNLEIILPDIDVADFNNVDDILFKLIKNFEKIATRIIAAKIKKIAGNRISKDSEGKTVVSKWHIFEKFLEDGHYPGLVSTKNQSIDKIFEELTLQSAQKMAELVFRIGKKNKGKIIDRIVYQFQGKYLNKLIEALYQKHGREAVKLIENIKNSLGRRYKSLKGQKSVNKAIVAAALEYILKKNSSGKFVFNARELSQFIVDAIQKKYRHIDENDLENDISAVKNEHSKRYSDLDVIEYFLENGSIPYWASTESQQSVQELFSRLTLKKLTGLQRIILKNIENESFIKRLFLQFGSEQILMLLEPLTDDKKRFLEDLMSEFQNAGFEQNVVLETALMLHIGGKGSFSKLEITRLALEKIEKQTLTSIDNLIENFYSSLREKSTKEYNLSRSELLRILNEIKPGYADQLDNFLAVYEKQHETEMELMTQIENIESKIKILPKGSKESEDLKKEQKFLLKKLTELIDSKIKSEISQTERADYYARLRKLLEIRVNSLNYNLYKLKEKNESDSQLISFENLLKIAEAELKKLNQSFDKHITITIKKSKSATDAEEQIKIRKELELILTLLMQEKNKIQNKITEVETEALQMEDSVKDSRLKIFLQSKRKKLHSELEKTEIKILEVKDIIEEIKPVESVQEETGSENSKLDFMIFFLQYGSVPWWAEAYKTQTISSIFSEFSVENPEKLRQAFSRVGRNPLIWQRLIHQLEEAVLEKVLLTLFPNFAGFAVSLAIMMEKIYESGIVESLKNIPFKYFKWSKVAEALFTNEGKFNPQHFVKEVVKESSKEFNIAPSSLLFYINNLSNNNLDGRLGIFVDIISPLTDDEELREVEKELLISAMRKKQEEEGILIPEEKKYDILSDYILKGVYADFTWKAGLNNPVEMEKLFWELLEKQNAAVEKLIEKAFENTLSRRRLSLEFSDDSFWEIVRMKGLKTLPLSKKYIRDLGKALGDDKMFFAKEVLLRTIYLEKGKPFVMEEFLFQLLREAVQITKRADLAIINEWKRKVYQLENVESAILLNLMQVELRHLKIKSDQSEDPSEKENLLQQMKSLQLEYQQQSQQLMYIYNKEQPQHFPDFEVPENPSELYRKIDETKTEIERLKKKFEENPKGENLLEQILSLRQLATLEGQLEVLELNEPLQIRQLQQLEKNLEVIIEQEEKVLSEIQTAKNILIPQLPEKTELDKVAELLEADEKLKLFIQEIRPEERADWIEVLKEKGNEIPEEWNVVENEQTKNLNLLALEELITLQNQISDSSNFVYRRISGRIKVLIARKLIEIKSEQKEILSKIENAETTEKAEALRKELLGFELRQNDLLDLFLAKVKDETIKNLLHRQRNQLRIIFQRMRIVADKRKADILEERREKQKQFIQNKKAEKEQLERRRKEFTEQIRSDKKQKEASVKAKKEEKKKKPEKIIEEPLYIKNAGLVILHPFFNRLFTTLNLVEKNKFLSEEAQIRAVHILQYIATGKTEHPENELVLNKIICGLPLSTPLPVDVGLTEEEIRVSNGLLNGAIANWPRLKTMSPDALRGTFILREGNIKEEADRWKLKVEKGSFDILLKTIPWAFTFVRSGWMPKFIMVEWPLPG